MTEQTVSIDGVAYYTLLEGPPLDPNNNPSPILLVHALMSNFHMYDSTIIALNNAGYSTLRFDHLGHNKTPPPKDKNVNYHMDDIVRHMHYIVKTVTGQENVKAVVGCSVGGVLALRYGMLYPHSVEKIISIAAPGISAPEKAGGLWTERVRLFEEDVEKGEEVLRYQTVERWFPGRRARDLRAREKALEQVRTCSLEGYRVLADTIRGYDYAGEEGRVEAETLILVGNEDGAASVEHLRGVAGRARKGRFAVLKGGGHLPPVQMEEEFEGVVLEFLKRGEGEA